MTTMETECSVDEQVFSDLPYDYIGLPHNFFAILLDKCHVCYAPATATFAPASRAGFTQPMCGEKACELILMTRHLLSSEFWTGDDR